MRRRERSSCSSLCGTVRPRFPRFLDPCVEALDVPFTVLSASELNGEYRKFFLANHPGRFQHVFCKMEEQLRDGSMHPLASSCVSSSSRESVDLMVTGSPCDPFSVMRSKRFCHDAVKCHPDFQTTMECLVSMYRAYEPRVATLEQVKGFTMPFEAGGGETPMERPFPWKFLGGT